MTIINFAAESRRTGRSPLRLVSRQEAWLPVLVRLHAIGRNDWDRGLDGIALEWIEPSCLRRQVGGRFALHCRRCGVLSVGPAELAQGLTTGLRQLVGDYEIIVAAEDLRAALPSVRIARILPFSRRGR